MLVVTDSLGLKVPLLYTKLSLTKLHNFETLASLFNYTAGRIKYDQKEEQEKSP